MKQSLSIGGLDCLDEAAAEFLRRTAGRKVIAFNAPMGAGKTTFISALCRAMGVRNDAVGSPTFAIVNEYRDGNGESIFHFDFYRIGSIREALDIGFTDYLDSGCLCLVEWPAVVEPLLPEETLFVDITVLEDGTRILSWEEPRSYSP